MALEFLWRQNRINNKHWEKLIGDGCLPKCWLFYDAFYIKIWKQVPIWNDLGFEFWSRSNFPPQRNLSNFLYFWNGLEYFLSEPFTRTFWWFEKKNQVNLTILKTLISIILISPYTLQFYQALHFKNLK